MNKSTEIHLHMGCGESLGGVLGHQAQPKPAHGQPPPLNLRRAEKPKVEERPEQAK